MRRQNAQHERRTPTGVTVADPSERAPEAERQAPSRRLPSSFSALSYYNYRLLWLGNLVSNTGDQMDNVSFNWLVYTLSDSAIWLGVVNLCRAAPILVCTLLGGVAADRIERRRMMFITQSAAMLMAILLAVLCATGVVQLWMVMAIAFGRGVMNSFNQPAKQSLVSELVPTEELRGALALNAAQFNLTKVFGPAIGGLLIASVGVVGAFYLNGVSFIAVLWGLALMRFADRPPTRPHGSIVGEMVEGVHYLRRVPTLGMLVLLALIPIILGNPYITMLTVFARDVLQVGPAGLGLLTAAASLGALIGAVAVGALRPARRGMAMLTALVGFGAALVVFSFSQVLALSLVALVLVGICRQYYLTLNQTVVQETVDPAYRGRVLSMLYLDRGLAPLGTMLAGFGTAAVGPEWALGTLAALLVLVALGAGRFAPALRRIA
ncbi:MAG: hypothetical protein QOF51_3094 [Chloroflexota bacterium]|jgi:MFS family permease|nr:hypothetical protein [Chloroflexota bacterium]